MTDAPLRKGAEELAAILSEKGLTLSLAESCTGGMIASAVIDIPGASSFFKGSAVTYSNESKEDLLNVPSGILIAHGAVSAETAEAMAAGAREIFGSDLAASATGIAGPGGGTDQKPIGTVFVAVTDGIRTECRRLLLKGSRDDIREGTAYNVIIMLRDLAGDG